jgi:D-threo-aldose 1-dehydrogenase
MDPFEAVDLGGTGKSFFRLGLGTAPLGGFQHPVDDREAESVVEAAYARGIRFFDTAAYYGHGKAEKIVGKVLGRVDPDSYVLASKVGYLLRRGAAPHAMEPLSARSEYEKLFPIYDFSREGVRRSYEESLARLGLERIDILHIHDPEEFLDQAIHEAFEELAVMRSEGLISAISAGSNSAEALNTLVRACSFDCILLANEYTLLNQSALDELLPYCLERNVTVIAGAVFQGGMLANPKTGFSYSAYPQPESALAKARELDRICSAHGVSLGTAAIQFPLGHPAVKSVIVGARSVAELDQDIEMFRADIPSGLWEDVKAAGLLAKDVPTPAGKR